MPNTTLQPDPNTIPPSGDSTKAQKYLDTFSTLLKNDKILALHTDLAQFDPSALQDHYQIELKDYHVEISHSKNPNSGADSFVMLFNNLKNVSEGCAEKVILAFMHLTSEQFNNFKAAADDQIERIRKAEEEKRLKEALVPIDQMLENFASGSPINEETPKVAEVPENTVETKADDVVEHPAEVATSTPIIQEHFVTSEPPAQENPMLQAILNNQEQTPTQS